jgi:hypothetical protein
MRGLSLWLAFALDDAGAKAVDDWISSLSSCN